MSETDGKIALDASEIISWTTKYTGDDKSNTFCSEVFYKICKDENCDEEMKNANGDEIWLVDSINQSFDESATQNTIDSRDIEYNLQLIRDQTVVNRDIVLIKSFRITQLEFYL